MFKDLLYRFFKFDYFICLEKVENIFDFSALIREYYNDLEIKVDPALEDPEFPGYPVFKISGKIGGEKGKIVHASKIYNLPRFLISKGYTLIYTKESNVQND